MRLLDGGGGKGSKVIWKRENVGQEGKENKELIFWRNYEITIQLHVMSFSIEISCEILADNTIEISCYPFIG